MIETNELSNRPPELKERSLWSSPRVWLGVFAVCTVIGLIEGTQAYLGGVTTGRSDFTWAEALAATMPSWYILGAMMPVAFWMARRFPLEDGRWRTSLLAHLPAAVVFAFVHLSLASLVSEFLLNDVFHTDQQVSFFMNMSQLLGVYFVIELFFYAMFVGSAHARDYRRQYRERERVAAQLALKTSRLEGSLTRANLESLRMQLNPHFLFNTLNAISVMALKGERHGVVRTLTLLSDLLRVSLENTAQVVPLRDELAFLERYLEIEEIRFKDRLTVHIDLHPQTMDAEVPTLLLQPLVENAIRHGISRKPGKGEITVRARAHTADATLVIEVTDTGPGFGTSIDNARAGIGLANTRARLEQLYGSAQALQLEDAKGGGALVRVVMPYRIAARDPRESNTIESPTVTSSGIDTLQSIA